MTQRTINLYCVLLLALPVFAEDRLARAVNANIQRHEIHRSSSIASLNRKESRQNRVTKAGHFRGVPATAVQYTLEEGNNWIIRLMVIRTNDFRVVGDEQVGGKGWRSVELKAVDGDVTLATMNYGESDPLGGPSLPGETHYHSEAGRLLEGDTHIYCSERAPN